MHDWSFGCGIKDKEAYKTEEEVEVAKLQGQDLFGRVQGMRWNLGKLGGDEASRGYEGGESTGNAGSATVR